MSMSMKNFWKSSDIWQSYKENLGVHFFWLCRITVLCVCFCMLYSALIYIFICHAGSNIRTDKRKLIFCKWTLNCLFQHYTVFLSFDLYFLCISSLRMQTLICYIFRGMSCRILRQISRELYYMSAKTVYCRHHRPPSCSMEPLSLRMTLWISAWPFLAWWQLTLFMELNTPEK